jgi:predicted RNase H-like HicB family nuclease
MNYTRRKVKMKKMRFTAIIEKSDDGFYVGQVQEFPEAISQGKTIEELKNNLFDALQLVIDCQREETMSLYDGKKKH